MTSPYSSSLLQQPVEDAPRAPRPTNAPMHTRSVTQVVAASQPVHAPMQPQVVFAAPTQRSGALTALVLGLLVVLVGAIALVGGYYATRQASPSLQEQAMTNDLAARDGFRAGRDRGMQAGHDQALANTDSTTALRASIARQRAYDAAYRRGERAGRSSYHAPRSGSGYRGRSYGGFRNADVTAAFGQAQGLANLTGAPVDVEIYN